MCGQQYSKNTAIQQQFSAVLAQYSSPCNTAIIQQYSGPKVAKCGLYADLWCWNCLPRAMLRQGSTWGALSAPTVTFRDIKPRVFTKLGNKSCCITVLVANTVTASIQQKYSKNTAKTCCISAVLLYLVPTHVVFAAVLIQQSECCMIQQLQQYS